MFPFDTPYNYLLYWSFFCAIGPWLYSYFNEQQQQNSMLVEQAILKSWERLIDKPAIKFKNIVVGINCNVDLVLSGVSLLNHVNKTILLSNVGDRKILSNVQDLYQTFTHFFSKGAPAERYMEDYHEFNKLVSIIENKNVRAQHYIGGNAALMAQTIASSFPASTAFLVGPIGPRSQALLHPSIVRNNSTRIIRDELHLILEYKQGEILSEFVAPASSRFITSHDQYSGSSLIIEMFFKAIAQLKPSLVIFSGVHLLEAQPKEVRIEKMRLIKRSLMQIHSKIPIHFHLGSMGDGLHVKDVLNKIIPYVDSLSINDQELAFLSKIGNGPYNEQYPVGAGSLHAYKVVEMLNWLITTFGNNKTDSKLKNYHYRLQRIHFYCLTYQIVVSRGTDWTNLAAGLAAGSRIAGRQACNINDRSELYDRLEIRTNEEFLLDKKIGKNYVFNPHNPLVSWIRDENVFLYTPILVCKYPQRTVGVDDAVSVTALLYSQFYKIQKTRW